MRRYGWVAALAAIGGIAPASAACWSQAEVAAAQVRDMQTMLMVAALRCRANGQDILPDYNAFVIANRDALEAINGRIKARFREDAGAIDGQKRYDRFTTRLANAYGASTSDADACAAAANLARRATADGRSPEALAALAQEAVFATPLPEAQCAMPPAVIAGPAAPAAPGVELAAAAR